MTHDNGKIPTSFWRDKAECKHGMVVWKRSEDRCVDTFLGVLPMMERKGEIKYYIQILPNPVHQGFIMFKQQFVSIFPSHCPGLTSEPNRWMANLVDFCQVVVVGALGYQADK